MAHEQEPVVDPFAVLGLTPEATDTDVRRAYRVRARDSHPDRGGDAATFLQVSNAYEALRTEAGRVEVARRVRGGAPGGTTPASTGAAGAGTGPAPAPGDPARRPGPEDAAARFSDGEQERLVGEFFRTHPDATAPTRPGRGHAPDGGTTGGVTGGPGTGARRGAHGPGGRLLPVLAGAGLAGVTLVLLAPDLLADLVGTLADVLSR